MAKMIMKKSVKRVRGTAIGPHRPNPVYCQWKRERIGMNGATRR